ncbi:MAG TPA: hypothetical protein VK943_11075 [Arenibaculum sp.]|nr:hypothetical protein [Arenibaculum sp.]
MQHSREMQIGGMSLAGILAAAAAFGLGYYLGGRGGGAGMGRWIGHEDSRAAYRRRNMGYRGSHRLDDTDDATTLDDYHRHLSNSRPGAPAGTPPDADVIIGASPARKPASESAAVLYDEAGMPIRSSETASSRL